MNVHQVQKNQQFSALTASLQSFSRATSVVTVLIGCVVIVGWIFDITLLKSVLPGLVTMKANTAMGFILGGVSLRLWHLHSTTFPIRRAAQASALILLLIALVTLFQFAVDIDLGIDQLLFHERQSPVNTTGLTH